MKFFRWGPKNNSSGKDYFSETIISTRPAQTVTEEKALQVPAVKAAVELISNSIGTLPIYLYEEERENNIKKVEFDERINRLNHDSNVHQTAQEIKKLVVKDFLLYGRAFIYKKENGELHYLEAKKMNEQAYTEDGFTISRREFEYQGFKTVVLQEDQLIVIDSSTNGILVDGGETINQALNQQQYSTSLLENGALPLGILKATSRLTEPAINRLRESWQNLYSGAKKAGKTVILEEGIDYSPISMKPDELDLTNTRKNTVSDIARIFNIPESLINSAANKYSSNEQNNITFYQNSLLPIITQIESALDKYLLDDTEKEIGYYFRCDVSEILRTTEKEKLEAISHGLEKGLFSFNEARTKLDLPRAEVDFYVMSMGNVLKYKDGRIQYLNLGQTSTATEVEESNGQKERNYG